MANCDLCGSLSLQIYLQDAGLSNETQVSISFAVSLMGFIMDSMIIDKTGRRKLMKFGLGLTTCLAVLLAFAFGIERSQGETIMVMTLFILHLYSLVYDSFIGGIPWIFNVEIHSLFYMGVGSSLASVFSYATDWVICKTIPLKSKSLSVKILLIYAVVSMIGFVLIHKLLPESLQRQEPLLPKRKRRTKSKSCMF